MPQSAKTPSAEVQCQGQLNEQQGDILYTIIYSTDISGWKIRLPSPFSKNHTNRFWILIRNDLTI